MNRQRPVTGIEYKSFALELDAAPDEEGVFTGYAAVYGNVDSHGDIIAPGAFTKTLQEKQTIPLIWQHDKTEPIGVVHLKDDGKGLRVERGELNMDVQRAREARALMQQKDALGGLSIGYKTVKFAKGTLRDSFKRRLLELKLHHASPVTFPSNQLAVVEGVKADGDVVWAPESGYSDLRDDITEALNSPDEQSGYWVQDIALDLSCARVGKYGSDITWVVPITLGDDSEPIIGPVAEWIEADLAYVQTPIDTDAVKSILDDLQSAGATMELATVFETKEGRVLSDASRVLVKQACDALEALLSSAEPGEKPTPAEGAADEKAEPDFESTLTSFAADFSRDARVTA